VTVEGRLKEREVSLELIDACIDEQPDALQRVLSQPWASAPLPEAALAKAWIVGSGTSYHAAMIAVRFWRQLGIDAEAVSSREFQERVDREARPGATVVAISQSGGTLSLVEAVRSARAHGCLTVGVTAERDSLLARTADIAVDSCTGPEPVFAKTKGFTTTALAASLVGPAVLGRTLADFPGLSDLPGVTATLVERSKEAARSWAERFRDVQAMFVVGCGALVPAAHEGALKLLEMAKLVVVGREFEEMLHGSFNAVGPETGIIVLANAQIGQKHVLALREAARRIGAPLLTIGYGRRAGSTDDFSAAVLRVADLASIPCVVPLQRLAVHLARIRGVDGAHTRHPFLCGLLGTKTMHAKGAG
jgi:glucoselysine-6-phosphate deglycase